MVVLIGGYPMSWADAKAWALRHWPDIDIYNETSLPYIIRRHNRLLGNTLACTAVSINAEPIFFVVVHSKRDPRCTPLKYWRFPERKIALKCKESLFNHEGDKELAEKTMFMTVADPWREYWKYYGDPSAPAPAQSQGSGSEESDADSESDSE